MTDTNDDEMPWRHGQAPSRPTPEERFALIDRYRSGAAVLAEAVGRLSRAQLGQAPPEGGWSPKYAVHHVADVDLNTAIRIRQMLSEERPAIQSYDPETFPEPLMYDRPVDPSLRIIEGVRSSTADIMERLSEEGWLRVAVHDEHGEVTVEEMLRVYANHCHDHAEELAQRFSSTPA